LSSKVASIEAAACLRYSSFRFAFLGRKHENTRKSDFSILNDNSLLKCFLIKTFSGKIVWPWLEDKHYFLFELFEFLSFCLIENVSDIARDKGIWTRG